MASASLHVVVRTPLPPPGTILRMAKTPMRLFVREWRKHRGLSQEQLAERLHTTAATISRIESGKQNWDGAFLEAVAEALNATPADLVRRGPADPQAIETAGLAPEQVELVRGMVEQLKRTGT